MMLTRRMGSNGSDVPHGPIKISMRRKNKTDIKSFQIIWSYTPEQITHAFLPVPMLEEPFFKWDKTMLTPLFEDLKLDKEMDPQANNYSLGSRQGFLPKLGKIWWMSDSN